MIATTVGEEEKVRDIVNVESNIPVKIEIPKDSVLNRLVPPHTKKSREITTEDIPKVIEEAKILHELCFTPIGFYKGAYAMHHSQIDDKEPLSFFVTADRRVIINPVITRHSNYLKDSNEACMTFGDKPVTTVQRWQKIEVDFVTLMLDPEDASKFKLSSPIQEDFSGFNAFVFQHEIDHGHALYIYTTD